VFPGDVAQLRGRLDGLLSDPAPCARLGVASRETVYAEKH
jgi:hypothetical protein